MERSNFESIYIYFIVFVSVIILFSTMAVAQQTGRTELSGPYLGQQPPGDVPKIFATGLVSTGREHSAAMFTPDGNEVWFGRIIPALIFYMRRTDGIWSVPEIASFCDTSTTSLYPVLSPDGNRIYFSSDRPMAPSDKKLPRGNYHLWVSERTGDNWSDPERLDEQINFGRKQSCGSITAGNDIYFTALVDGRSMDLFYSRNNDGKYGDIEALDKLNSGSPDHSPYVSVDGSYMIFSSFRNGFGRSDLFISFRMEDSTWSEPINMGPGINSAYKDEYPFVSPDGKYLFFNSNRPSILNAKPIEDGPGNIYWVDSGIIEILREGEM